MDQVQHAHAIKIEQFDGPFHLLVELLEKEKLNITEVSLSKVTEQYLTAINPPQADASGRAGGQGKTDPHILADFLLVAARLLYLKSKALLPMLAEEEDEEVSLEDQIKMYKQYYEASKVIEKMLATKRASFAREKIAVDVDVVFNPPHNLTVHKMKEIFGKVLKELEPIVRVPRKIARQVVSIRDKIKGIHDLIIEKMTSSFSELVKGSKDKTESIVTFLALLELVKQRVITVEQQEMHGDISITRKTAESHAE